MRRPIVRALAAVVIFATAAEAQNRVNVHGIAYDSLHARPLAGAFVSIIGTSLSAMSDSAGRFSFENVAPGSYRFAAQHDVIDAIGMSAIGGAAKVTDGKEIVRLFVPSFGQLWRVVCGVTPPGADTGFVFGNVRAQAGMKSMSHVVVAASWLDLVVTGKTVAQKIKTLEVNADSTGNFALCGVPTTTGLGVRAYTDSAESGMFAVDPLDKERIARRDVRLGVKLTEIIASKKGSTLSGRVLGDSGVGLISNAEIQLEELGLRTTTNDKGEYTIADIVPGSHTVHVRRIGYAEVVGRVDFEQAESRQRDFVISKVVVLDSVAVKGTAIPREDAMRAFEDHKRLGLGKFLTRAELEKAGERPLASLLQQFNGLQVIRGRDGKSVLYARRGTKSIQGNQSCPVTVYIEGVAVPSTVPVDINEYLPADLEAVEYFAGAGRIPAEYNRLNSTCGVLVLHSRYKK